MAQLPVTISGNLTNDPEMITFDTGTKLVKFRIASSRRVRATQTDANGRETEGWTDTDQLFIDVEAWGLLAENVDRSLFKGAPVVASGYLVTNTWTEQLKPTDVLTAANGERLTGISRAKVLLKAHTVAFDLTRHKVGSEKTAQQVHNPDGIPFDQPGADGSDTVRDTVNDAAAAGSQAPEPDDSVTIPY